MIYIAKHYVPVNGQMHRPGEAFEAELSEKQLKWLMKKGAIEATGATFEDVLAASGMDEDDYEPDGEDLERMGAMISDAADAVRRAEEAAGMAEEAPEIDVMDGISAPEEQQDAPKAGRRKK